MRKLISYLVAVGIICLTYILKELRAKARAKTTLNELEKIYTEIKMEFEDDSEFMRYSFFETLKEDLQFISQKSETLKNIFFYKRIKILKENLKNLERDMPNLRKKVNDRFFLKEKERAREIFFDEKGKELLTDEQLKAVLCDDDRNLIIAGAGSGKTRVIDFKIKYLIKYKKVNPEKILVLSFSKKSAGDLTKKITQTTPSLEAKTIHGFARKCNSGFSRKIFNEDEKEQEKFFIKALSQSLKNKEIFESFNLFYEKYFSEVKPLIFYKNFLDLKEDLKKTNSGLEKSDKFFDEKALRSIKTLKGDFVRYLEERYIADFLWLQGISYEYEKKYPFSAEEYYPSFYLVEYDLYLEHFALDSTSHPLPALKNPSLYQEGIDRKRKFHSTHKTRLIEIHNHLLNQKGTSQYLTELLTEKGIKVDDLLENETTYEKITNNFLSIFSKFYQRFRSSNKPLEEIKLAFKEERYSLFLKVFEKFLLEYNQLTQTKNRMSFDDMIYQAIGQYREKNGSEYEYLIVDEFQDTSKLATTLFDEILKSNRHSSFFGVGDDWQSIYGFNGSDVSIISNYAEKYPNTTISYLNSNFRSHSNIVKLGKKFISKNPSQIKKNPISRNTNFQNGELDFIPFEKMIEKIKNIPTNESVFILYRNNKDSPLDKYFFNNFFIKDNKNNFVRDKSYFSNVSLMTIHASKGLEAQHVFCLFPDRKKGKFPSEIIDHFIFDMVKSKSEKFPFAEERRLMYVAITRAEQNLYLVSPYKSQTGSIFWDELKEISKNLQSNEELFIPKHKRARRQIDLTQ